MEIEINLDEMTERYVRSIETKIEIYKNRMWTMFIIGLALGIYTGIAIAIIVK